MIHVPEGTFLHSYLRFMEAQETPVIYDLMTGLWILSNALGRDVVVARPRIPVHLNMFLVLVSDSGIMRKSSSIRAATTILRKWFEVTKNPTTMIESKVKQRELLYELHRSTKVNGFSHLVFVASELAASFGRGIGANTVVALITDLYDCPDFRTAAPDFINKEAFNFKNTYCSFLAGSTPTWLEQTVTQSVVEGGFASRCYFIVGDRRKRSIPWPAETNEVTIESLLDQLKEIVNDCSSRTGINLNPNALKTFQEWYNGRTLHKDAYRESFESREDSHTLRLAGLMAANDRSWLINDDHLRRAINLTGTIRDYGTRLFTGESIRTTDLAWIRKVRDTLLRFPEGISRTDFGQMLNRRGEKTVELQATIQVMHELDLIEIAELRWEGMVGRPRTVYKPTVFLQNEEFLKDAVRKLGLER